MSNKKFLFFSLGVALSFIGGGYYFEAFLVLASVVCVYGFAIYLTWDMFELWSKMPTVWQDIPETLVLADPSWFDKHSRNMLPVTKLYRKISTYRSLFDLRVDERVMESFEELHPEVSLERFSEVAPMSKALFYFGIVYKFKQELLPDIQGVILVRKKVGGEKKKVPPKPVMVFNPVYN